MAPFRLGQCQQFRRTYSFHLQELQPENHSINLHRLKSHTYYYSFLVFKVENRKTVREVDIWYVRVKSSISGDRNREDMSHALVLSILQPHI
jgi:hypothetical protein